MNASIVCGIDSSDVARSAARVAAQLARELDVRLILVHVADDAPAFPYGDARLRELKRRDATTAGTAMLEGVAASVSDVEPETRVLFGDPVEALTYVTESEESEFLVVGSRGRGPLTAAMLGSVSRRLAGTAGCPVVVVPSEAAANRFLLGTPGGRVVSAEDGSRASSGALRLPAGLAEHTELEVLPMPIDSRQRLHEQAAAETVPDAAVRAVRRRGRRYDAAAQGRVAAVR